jgi:hypothetical protein
MGGYADRADGVQGEHDPLEVHAVTFTDGDHRFALIVVDLICVNDDIVDRVRLALRSLDVDTSWVSATHTHASPEAGCFPGGSTTPADLGSRLLAASVAATKAALAAERESALGSMRVQIPGLAGWRNRADSPVDIPVDALLVLEGDTVVGAVVVCPVHPTVFAADNNHVGADLSGGIRRALGAPERWIVVATGAAGNISTRYTRRDRSAREVDRLGAMVAAAIDLDQQVSPSYHVRIRPPAERVIQLEPKTPDEVNRAMRFELDASRSDDRSRQVLEQGRRLAGDLVAQARSEPYPVAVQAVGIGPVTLVAIPAELFLELGEAIRAGASHGDQHAVIVLGYTNGYLGYLPARDTRHSYEALVSPVRQGSGELVVETAITLARDIAEKGVAR